MLPAERQRRIIELVNRKQFIKISELSEELKVSEMTVHRDIKPLIEKGLVLKTFGGITLAGESSLRKNESIAERCVYCTRGVNPRLAYRLIFADSRIEHACCAHCGLLRWLQLEGQVQHAICHDFLLQTTISAPLAYYVFDASLHINCCQPQVLTFELGQHAEMFVKGFGGTVYSFSEALEVIQEKMRGCAHTACQQTNETN